MTASRKRIVIGVLATALVVGTVLLARRDGPQDTTTSSTTPTADDLSTTTSSVASTTAPSTVAPTTTSTVTVEAVLADGRHPVYLTAFDVEGRTVEFDLIQHLTGAEADAAFHRDSPGQAGGAPNDFYIVNDNPRLRTLPLAHDVSVTVLGPPVTSTSPYAIALEDLPRYLADYTVPADGGLWYNPFWLNVRYGEVVAIEEQFTP